MFLKSATTDTATHEEQENTIFCGENCKNIIEFPKSQHIQTSPFTSSTKAVVNIYPHKRAQRHLQVFYSSTVIFSFGSF